jgi:acetyltransferase-like isoleucine patch superfamily enzyme
MFLQKLQRGLDIARGSVKALGHHQSGWLAAGRGVTIRANLFASIRFGCRVNLGEGCGIAVFGSRERIAKLTIGDRTYFQPRVRINCSDHIAIGADCAFSWEIDILDTDFHSIVETDGKVQPNHAPIQIGDRVWVGIGAKILKGVTIGDDVVVAAGAVVTRSVPSRTLVAGSPAKVIRQIAGWKP